MDYLKIKDIAKKWGISPRRVQTLCGEGKIEGAVRFGRDWMIPKGTRRPADGRTKAARSKQALPVSQPLPRQTPFLYMSDLYSTPGTADAQTKKLADHPEAQLLFAMDVSYSRGQIDKVCEQAQTLLDKGSGFYATLSAGMLLALCAIWRGDLALWRKAKLQIAHAPATTEMDQEIISLSITAVDSMLYDDTSFPDWFKAGCFEPLHPDSLPAVKVFYAKYLYMVSFLLATQQISVEGLQGLSMMKIVPYTIEPLISWAMAEHSLISEAYLRLICAVVYHSSGNDAQAIVHIDRAIALTLPDKLYGLLAEYTRTLDILLEKRLNAADPNVWPQVKALYSIYNKGWSHLSGSVRGRTIITSLSRREREVAKLAAFGMRNAEIAKRLHISLSGVKQAIRIVSEKTGVGRDEFAAYL